jgi:hypothetical protein
MYNRLKSIAGRINIEQVMLIWLFFNLISASCTLLYSDETYYWLYAKKLSFGYFDHPPMIALFIWLGTFLTSNEMGVRIIPVLAITVSLLITYRLAGINKPFLYFVAISSVFALNLLGFMALPDAPLLMFTACFFLAYRKFLLEENIKNACLLGIIMAALLYSKYHGVLVILFTLCSNFKLVKSWKFWLAVFIGALLFIPHILWQVNNKFITFSYHLFERSASHYKASVTFEYIIGQLLFYGPLTGIFMYIALLKFKIKDLFDRALVWNVAGILGFFLITTLKGRVEVNWTLPVIIPLLIIFLRFSDTKSVFRKRFYIFTIPSVILIVLLRIQLFYPLFKIRISRIDDLRNQKEFVNEVRSRSAGLPIVSGTYQKAGIISFYSGSFSPGINLNSRRNQFNLWHSDDTLRYKKIAYVNNYLNEGINIKNPLYNDYRVTIIDSFPVMNDILINVKPQNIVARGNDRFNVTVKLETDKSYINFRDAGGYHTRLYAGLYSKDGLLYQQMCSLPVDLILKNNEAECEFTFTSPVKKGHYKILLELKTSALGTWSNRGVSRLTVN